MRRILLAVLFWSVFTASGHSQTASPSYSALDSVEVSFLIEVVRDKQGRPMGQTGAQPWDVGVPPITLPDIAFCVDVPGKMRWCSPGFESKGQAKPHCRDSLKCEASVRMPRGATFEIVITDVDLQFHDLIGGGTCRVGNPFCPVGAAVVSLRVIDSSDFCRFAQQNFDLNMVPAGDWRRTSDRHKQLVDQWAREGERRFNRLSGEIGKKGVEMARGTVEDFLLDSIVRDVKTVLLEVREVLINESGGKPLARETKQQLRAVLQRVLQDAKVVSHLETFNILKRRLKYVEFAGYFVELADPASDVFEAGVAWYDSRRIAEYLNAWRNQVAQQASSLADEARLKGCPIPPKSIERYEAIMAGRIAP